MALGVPTDLGAGVANRVEVESGIGDACVTTPPLPMAGYHV